MSKFNVGDIVYCKKAHLGYYLIHNIAHFNLFKKTYFILHEMSYCRNRIIIAAPFGTKNDVLNKYFEKQSVRRIQCSKIDFKFLERMHGIGCFYHDISPFYEKLCANPPKFIIFRNMSTKQQLVLHLGKATKVLKRIGFEHNGNYKPVKVVKMMVKLQFIGEL